MYIVEISGPISQILDGTCCSFLCGSQHPQRKDEAAGKVIRHFDEGQELNKTFHYKAKVYIPQSTLGHQKMNLLEAGQVEMY